MSNETIVTIVGNLTADPELRFTQNGLAVANFTIASTPKVFDKQTRESTDGDPLFMRASVWREFAENVAASLVKGSRVIAQGRLKQRSFETQAGEKRTVIELEVDEIGPDLRFATAQVTRKGQGARSQPATATNTPAPSTHAQQPAQDVWGAPGTDYTDGQVPF